LLYNLRSLVVLFVQHYKSLCAALTICVILVNIQTETRMDRQMDGQHLISIYESSPVELKGADTKINTNEQTLVQ